MYSNLNAVLCVMLISITCVAYIYNLPERAPHRCGQLLAMTSYIIPYTQYSSLNSGANLMLRQWSLRADCDSDGEQNKRGHELISHR